MQHAATSAKRQERLASHVQEIVTYGMDMLVKRKNHVGKWRQEEFGIIIRVQERQRRRSGEACERGAPISIIQYKYQPQSSAKYFPWQRDHDCRDQTCSRRLSC